MKFFNLLILSVSSYALTLDSAIEEALSKNMRILEKEKISKEIYYKTQQAYSGYLPKVDLTSTIPIENTRKNNFIVNDYDYELTLTQNIFNGFKDFNTRNQEIAKYGSAQYSVKELKNSFSLSIISAYIDILKQQEIFDIQVASLQNRMNIFEKIKIKYESGMGTELEYRLSKSSLNLAKVDLEDQRHTLNQAIILLENYLNRKIGAEKLQSLNKEPLIPSSINDAIITAHDKHPSMYVSKLNIELTKSEKELSKNNFYPSIDFKASYYDGERDLYKSIDSYYDIYFQLTYNLFDGLNDYNRLGSQNEKLKQKIALLEDVKRDIAYKINSKYYFYNLLKRKSFLMYDYMVSQEEVLESYNTVFSIGKANLRDILRTTDELYNAKKNYADITFELLKSKYAILEAMGQLPLIETVYRKPNKIEKIKKYIVKATKLNIRKTQSLKSDIIGYYTKDNVVAEIKSTNKWILTDQGWIYKKYLREVINE